MNSMNLLVIVILQGKGENQRILKTEIHTDPEIESVRVEELKDRFNRLKPTTKAHQDITILSDRINLN
ncbi:hypothetical protein KAR91_12345 [Candidatus Pacearchaeota archaeon]|nr:hypothetical protein [Candidatus Pacearchaeota archaeon]